MLQAFLCQGLQSSVGLGRDGGEKGLGLGLRETLQLVGQEGLGLLGGQSLGLGLLRGQGLVPGLDLVCGQRLVPNLGLLGGQGLDPSARGWCWKLCGHRGDWLLEVCSCVTALRREQSF